MKRISKKSHLNITGEELDQLNFFEQRSLLGGFYGSDTNTNEITACKCEYSNKSSVVNDNGANGCQCLCI